MAIGARCMGHRNLEIALCVAFAARYAAVFAEKRKGGLRVVETLELCHLCPFRCVVARLAGSFEASSMRIRVAGGAGLKGKPGVSDVRLGISYCAVALGAGHNGVRSCQREFCRRMNEARSRLPGICSVALGTVLTQLPAMIILMATRACTAESQIGVI